MNKRKQYQRYLRISQARYLNQVGFLIGISSHELRVMRDNVQYTTFSVPKVNGGKRLIENPAPDLKHIQRGLNKYLQCLYYQVCPDASYGFVMNVKRRPSKSIIANAARHMGARYMMNIDLESFFHTVTQGMVDDVLMSDIFALNQESVEILSEILCYKGRLPMGAPTSPVMSNLASLSLDYKLMKWCHGLGITYTRYADDMTFSSQTRQMTTWEYDAINAMIKSESYTINVDKVKVLGPDDPKAVTGIYVHEDRLSLSETFIDDTIQEIGKLKTNLEMSQRYDRIESPTVRKHRQVISGYINYAKQIYGAHDAEVLRLIDAYDDALNTIPWDTPVSWRAFPYASMNYDFTFF